MNTTRKTVAVLISTTTLLGLSGCTGAGSVYDFSPTPVEPSDSVKIELPDDLMDVAGLTDDNLIVSSYALRSRSLDSAQYCAYDVEINYAPGALEIISAPTYTEADAKKDMKEAKAELLAELEVSSFENGGEEYIQRSMEAARDDREQQLESWGDIAPQWLVDSTPENYATTVLGHSTIKSYAMERLRDSNVRYDHTNPPTTVQSYFDWAAKDIEAEYQVQVDAAAKVGEPERVATQLQMSLRGMSREELSENDPQGGVYFDDDLKSATVVQDCAPSLLQSSTRQPLSFVTLRSGTWDTLAVSDVAVMADGTIGVSGVSREFIRDANGTWIKN